MPTPMLRFGIACQNAAVGNLSARFQLYDIATKPPCYSVRPPRSSRIQSLAEHCRVAATVLKNLCSSSSVGYKRGSRNAAEAARFLRECQAKHQRRKATPHGTPPSACRDYDNRCTHAHVFVPVLCRSRKRGSIRQRYNKSSCHLAHHSR